MAMLEFWGVELLFLLMGGWRCFGLRSFDSPFLLFFVSHFVSRSAPFYFLLLLFLFAHEKWTTITNNSAYHDDDCCF